MSDEVERAREAFERSLARVEPLLKLSDELGSQLHETLKAALAEAAGMASGEGTPLATREALAVARAREVEELLQRAQRILEQLQRTDPHAP